MILHPLVLLIGAALTFLFLGYWSTPLWGWTLAIAAFLLLLKVPLVAWGVFSLVAMILNLPILRQWMLTANIMTLLQRMQWLPRISETERAAIEAGTVWVEREFFTGKPNFSRLMSEPFPQVTEKIQDFLSGPVEQVCRMTTDWEIYQRKDLPPQVWDYLKQERFFGMMIPKEYGGLGFTNLAYSAVMNKLASRSFTHVATVGVTNSLGPAKLLLRYGTQAQKNKYLPRLARGEEIPCFALTEPQAGSDAASLTSDGVVFQGADGELYLKLNWQKRYITLGAIATLIGLAVRLRDPENLLGKGEDLGITCVLVPTDTPGVQQNRRHDPMGVPFYNSPLTGHDVILSVEQIIGGVEQAGQGWKMIMQSLASGRGVSFPASCAGVAKLAARATGAYGVVRQQFGLSIGRFTGVEEALARIAGLTYMIDAIRLYTCGAVDQGEQPAVASAIAKYHTTELTRQVINDGMDVLGGAGICRGPHNLLANIYTALPISITVEGANILTRTLMIFGQGAIRCHPYVYDEIQALRAWDVQKFDRVFWAHLGLILSNFCRVKLLTLTRGAFAKPHFAGPTARYYRQMAWASALFALLSDGAMVILGSTLKRQETLTGRLADMLSWLYLGTATLRKFEAEGRNAEDLPVLHWAMQYAFAQYQAASEGLVTNLPVSGWGQLFLKPLAWALRLSPLGRYPSDALGHQVAQYLQTPGAGRDRLTQGIYTPEHPDEALGQLEQAFLLAHAVMPVLNRIKEASDQGLLPAGRPAQLIEAALQQGLIDAQEAKLITEAERSRIQAIQVDSFTIEDYQQGSMPLSSPETEQFAHQAEVS